MHLRWTWFALILGLLSTLPVVGQWQAHFADSVSLAPSVWQGTLDKFRCNPTRGLQLNDSKASGTTNYAYILLRSTRWRHLQLCSAKHEGQSMLAPL